MPIIRSTRPSLDVEVNIFHSLYPVGRERWHTVLMLTDDPGPDTGQITIYGDMAQLMQDYPIQSATYRAAAQFFQQHNTNDLWILPIATANGMATPVEWAEGLNNLIANRGLNFYYVVMVSGHEDATAELADAANNYEVIPIIRNYAGAKATKTTGTSTAELVWTVRREGALGNDYTLEYVNKGSSEDLEITAVQNDDLGYDIEVSLETDVGGDVQSTADDVRDAVAADPVLSFLVHVESGGAGTLSTEVKGNFTGGGAGASTVSSFNDILLALSSSRVFGMAHDQPNRYSPDVVAAAMFSTMNPGSFTPKNRIPQGIPPAQFTPTQFSNMREGNTNSIFRNPAGHINITDGFASDGLFIDIQMAIDVMAHWQRMAIWDLLSQPPAGYHKVPYDNDGFQMILDRLYHTLARGARPEWNFIVSRAGKPACRIMAPTFEQTDIEDRKNRIYRPRWEATYKGAVHEVVVTGYLTVEFIPPTEQRLGEGITFTYT